jgi:acyl-coenzyme A synthetase/AMP-(fatty) acid ligase
MTIYTSTLAPFSDITNLSIPRFMTRYNPDGVSADKVVHMDTFSNEHLTYGSLREKASRAAWGLKNQLGVRPGDAVLAIVTNSVRLATIKDCMVYSWLTN